MQCTLLLHILSSASAFGNKQFIDMKKIISRLIYLPPNITTAAKAKYFIRKLKLKTILFFYNV